MAERAIDFPATRWRFVAPTRAFVQGIAGAYLAQFLVGHLSPRSYYVPGRGWNGGTGIGSRVIILDNGSEIQLLSYEDPVQAHEGDELNGAVLDEPPPFAHLMATLSRLLDRKGQLFIGATMVNRPDPTLREMVEGDDESPKEGRTVHTSGWVQYVGKLSSDDCPWMSTEDVEERREELRCSPWDYAQRIDGAWEGVTAGRRFAMFTEANSDMEDLPGKPLIALAIDHGEAAGHQHFLLAAYEGTRIHIFDEYVNAKPNAPEVDARYVVDMFTKHRLPLASVDFAVGDTNSAGKGYGLPVKVNDLLERAFTVHNRGRLPFRIQPPDKTDGAQLFAHRCINWACDRKDLTVHPRCTKLLDTLRNWKGTTRRGSQDAKLAHAADALAYLIAGTLGETATYSRLRMP